MKKYSKIIIGLAVALLILSPMLILAQGKKAGGSDRICAALTQIKEKIEQRLTQRGNQLSLKQEEIGNRYTERRQEREMKLEQRREKWDENREEHFAKLEERAQTQEQKQAVIEFVQIITQAVKDRRAAFDQAILDFQEGLNSIHQSRRGILENAVAVYKESVDQAFAKAEEDCNMSELRNDLMNIRDQYREDVGQFLGHGEQIQELIETKKEAMNQAKDEFRQILEQTLEDLKASLPEEETEETEE